MQLVRSLVDVATTMTEIAGSLRSVASIRSVHQTCSMTPEQAIDEFRTRVGEGKGFRIEWSVGGEFEDGRALTFIVEFSWQEPTWTVQASIRLVDGEGERPLFDVAPDAGIDLSLLIERLATHSAALSDRRLSALDDFLLKGKPSPG